MNRRDGEPSQGSNSAWWDEALTALNLFYFQLDVAVLELLRTDFFDYSLLANRDVARGTVGPQGHWKDGVSSQSRTGFLLMERYLVSRPDPVPARLNPRIQTRNLLVVPESVLDRAAAALDEVLSNGELTARMSAITKAVSQYKNGDFVGAVVFAWFAVERVLRERWTSFLDQRQADELDGTKRINSDRRKLLAGRDYTASIVSNVLELEGTIPTATFRKLDRVRQLRNDIVHQLDRRNCGREEAAEAIGLAMELSVEGTGISSRWNDGMTK